MMWAAMILVVVSVAMSALFSGSETGFYRVTRTRLLLDALDGDRLSKALLFLTNRPSFFVATVLVGNNLANYLTSLAIVLASQPLSVRFGASVELAAPLLLAPGLFVYGELLPKSLFYVAPYRLLRITGPVILLFSVVFLPLSMLLYVFGKLLELLAGESPQVVQLNLARKELVQIVDEGHEAGILSPAQRALAQGLFVSFRRKVSELATPLADFPTVHPGMPKSRVLETARSRREAFLLVVEAPADEGAQSGNSVTVPLGYHRVIDLQLMTDSQLPPPRPLDCMPLSESLVGALVRMHNNDEAVAGVVDDEGHLVGIVTAQSLSEPLFTATPTREASESANAQAAT